MTQELANHEIARIDWSSLRASGGTAHSVPSALKELLDAKSLVEVETAYWKLENTVVVQGQLFPAAAHVVRVLVIGLQTDKPIVTRRAILELLYQIVAGKDHHLEIDIGNSGIADQCKRNAREAIWIFYRELLQGEYEAAQEILGVIEENYERLSYYQAIASNRAKVNF